MYKHSLFKAVTKRMRQVSFVEVCQEGDALAQCILRGDNKQFYPLLERVANAAKNGFHGYLVTQHNLYYAVFTAAQAGRAKMLAHMVTKYSLSVSVMNVQQQSLYDVTTCQNTKSCIRSLERHEKKTHKEEMRFAKEKERGFTCS